MSRIAIAAATLCAFFTLFVPSSHGRCIVPAPNGSLPVPRNVCQ